MNTLEIKNLNVSIDGQAILKEFNLTVPKGEVHALMGPNGTGKSTLAKVMAGHEDYTVESGEILLDGVNILGEAPDVIAKAGLFLAFQYPLEIPGVSIANFIRASRQARLPEGEDINSITKSSTPKSMHSKWIVSLQHVVLTKASRVARKNAAKSCKCRCLILNIASWMRPTLASTSTRFALFPKV